MLYAIPYLFLITELSLSFLEGDKETVIISARNQRPFNPS